MQFRSFIALEIPRIIQKEISDRIYPMVQHFPRPLVKWVDPNNYHLTLCFLGIRTGRELDTLARSIRDPARATQPFKIRFNEMGTFPNYNKPRVIWVGIDAPRELYNLQVRIEDYCIQRGYLEKSKGFSPHLTLGRIRDFTQLPKEINLKQTMTAISFNNIDDVLFEEIKIIKSNLGRTGPKYSQLFSVPLGFIS
ncbi:RNA 2',3'-cyclic phosphodiesterase [Chloroflexota bacterium]